MTLTPQEQQDALKLIGEAFEMRQPPATTEGFKRSVELVRLATLRERERLRKIVEVEQMKVTSVNPTREAWAGRKYCEWFLDLLSVDPGDSTNQQVNKPNEV